MSVARDAVQASDGDLAQAIAEDIDNEFRIGCGGVRRSLYADELEEVVAIAVRSVLTYRREHWAEGNDKVWGEGNWVECHQCELDHSGFPVFHHKDHHQ